MLKKNFKFLFGYWGYLFGTEASERSHNQNTYVYERGQIGRDYFPKLGDQNSGE